MIKKYSVTINGDRYDVEVEEIGSEISVAEPVVAAPVKKVAPVKKATPVKKAAPASISGGTDIQAPMPGKVLDIKTSVGAQVKNGEVLLILEAMKMENEIVSNVDGTVKAINVSAGSSVDSGDVLIVIG